MAYTRRDRRGHTCYLASVGYSVLLMYVVSSCIRSEKDWEHPHQCNELFTVTVQTVYYEDARTLLTPRKAVIVWRSGHVREVLEPCELTPSKRRHRRPRLGVVNRSVQLTANF
ncbi:hypothetical protein C8Q76DRAFT_309972 [Earliella scabrosa]|nr:hypothetical protein C8Q76DRAFT_309972 [Earliella scabrosa]